MSLNTLAGQDLKHFLAFLVYQKSNAWKETNGLQRNIPTQTESFRLRP